MFYYITLIVFNKKLQLLNILFDGFFKLNSNYLSYLYNFNKKF